MNASEQARADALADAETLRLCASFWITLEAEDETWENSGYVLIACEWGRRIISEDFCCFSPEGMARRAAHNIFRAVPELRG